MSRNPLIEAIHAARYDLETSAAHDQAASRRKLADLVAQAIIQSNMLKSRYWESRKHKAASQVLENCPAK